MYKVTPCIINYHRTVQIMTTIRPEQMTQYTYMECLECCSVHRMPYDNGEYECEECYRRVDASMVVDKDDIMFNEYMFIREFRAQHDRDPMNNRCRKMIIKYMNWVRPENTSVYNKALVQDLYDDLLLVTGKKGCNKLFAENGRIII